MLLSACLIVRDEAHQLERCLRSLEGVVDEVVVVDTGSVDDTRAVVTRLGARLFEHPWSGDFSEARNVALGQARGEFVLSIDADEELAPETGRALREAAASGRYDVVRVDIVSQVGQDGSVSSGRYPRLFRRYPDARFTHRIHEQIWPSLAPHRPRVFESQLRIVHHGYAQSDEVLRKKKQRNLQAALDELRDHPDDPFYLYHVGLGHLMLDGRAEAVPILERALARAQTPDGEALVLNLLGQARLDEGQEAEGVRLLERSVSRLPQQRQGWALLGDLHFRRGRHAEAATAFRACLAVTASALSNDLAPSEAIVWMRLGLSLLMTRRAGEAVAALERALGIGLGPEAATVERSLQLARKLASLR